MLLCVCDFLCFVVLCCEALRCLEPCVYVLCIVVLVWCCVYYGRDEMGVQCCAMRLVPEDKCEKTFEIASGLNQRRRSQSKGGSVMWNWCSSGGPIMTEGRGRPRSLIPGPVLEQQADRQVKAIGRQGAVM